MGSGSLTLDLPNDGLGSDGGGQIRPSCSSFGYLRNRSDLAF